MCRDFVEAGYREGACLSVLYVFPLRVRLLGVGSPDGFSTAKGAAHPSVKVSFAFCPGIWQPLFCPAIAKNPPCQGILFLYQRRNTPLRFFLLPRIARGHLWAVLLYPLSVCYCLASSVVLRRAVSWDCKLENGCHVFAEGISFEKGLAGRFTRRENF